MLFFAASFSVAIKMKYILKKGGAPFGIFKFWSPKILFFKLFFRKINILAWVVDPVPNHFSGNVELELDLGETLCF